MFKPNFQLVKSWAFKYYDKIRLYCLILITIDGLWTILSVQYLKYVVELNPLVVLLSPFGALVINLGLMYFLKKKTTDQQYTFFTLLFVFVLYVYADLNHVFQLLRYWYN